MPCGTASADEVVTFADPNLETAVREKLGVAQPSPVTASDMLGLYSLDIHGAGITDLAGLEYATNFEICVAAYNAIGSVEPLRELTPLVHLHLYSNLLTDISPIAGLTNLTALSLGANRLTQVDAVSQMRELTDLEMGGNLITDVSGLGGLEKLRVLDLTQNRVEEVSPLAGLSELHVLWLGQNRLGDISTLAALSELHAISLEDNQVADVSPLAGLRELDYLDLRGNPLNQAAYDTYLPLIEANNPGIDLHYDPIPEPASLVLVVLGALAILGRSRRGAKRAPARKGHGPTPESNAVLYAFFEHVLKAGR